MESATVSSQISADEFFRGFLAALAARNHQEISGSQPTVHRAFYRVVKELRKPETKGVLDVDLFEVDYDPLYSQSGWFDQALTRAQRNLIVSFPNPTYERMVIRYKQDDAKEVLATVGNQDAFEKLADLFWGELQRLTLSSTK